MVKTLILRDYQQQAVDALNTAFYADGLKRAAVVLYTGGGKTVIFAHLVAAAVEAGIRPLILVHRDELVRQTIDKISSAAPDVTIGVIKAERNELHGDVLVASIQTISRQSRLDQLPADLTELIIVDECHHTAADTWSRVLEHFGGFDPDSPTRVAGFTATLERGDDRSLGDVWQEVVYSRDVMHGIKHGHLVDVRGQMVKVAALDLDSVKRARGDYTDGGLASALEEADVPATVAAAYDTYARRPRDDDRVVGPRGELRRGILFAPTVASAESFAEQFNAHGIPAEVVTGTTPTEERQLIYKRLAAGDIKLIASCQVLTEGFDLPEVEVAVMARPTSRAGLYVQMVGRILRPAPWTGKTEALVLDVVGVSERHKLATLADLSPKTKRVADGESLFEAEFREETEKSNQPERSVPSARRTAEVELFAASTAAWSQTYTGLWFVSTAAHVYFLWPTAEGFRIGKAPVRARRVGRRLEGCEWLLDYRPFTIERAMAWATQEAEEEDPTIASRDRSWRVKRQKPSEAQLKAARFARVDPDGMTKGELSEALSIAFTSRMLDPFVKSAS